MSARIHLFIRLSLLTLPALPMLAMSSQAIAATGTVRGASNDSSEVRVAKAGVEQMERDVDAAALSAQDLAISRLMTLLKKYQNNPAQEPILLSKLADIQQQKAAILFRLAHGNAARSRKAIDYTQHRKELKASIGTLDRLISRYPDFEEIPHAWFLRGKAYEESEKKDDAGKNYLHLVRTFPNAEDTTSAYMSLADFAIDANDHARAIGFLKEVEKRPEDPHYPFALYKLAWSHYNLKNIPSALSYAERQIAFYDERRAKSESDFNRESDNALRENMLLDVTVFYFEGYESKEGKYAVEEAMPYFQKLEKGPVLGKMLLRFAKLLRSHSHERDLMSWKERVLADFSDSPESLDVVILTYEFALNQHKYDRVVACAQDMVKLWAKHKAYESFGKAQKQLLDTAEGLQQLIVKNKGANEVGSYSRVLAQVYDAFVRVVEETDPRIPRAHYNLAETLFTIKDFNGATDHYRWVVDHGKWNAKPVASKSKQLASKKQSKGETAMEAEASVVDASLKAIGARYEVLHAKKLIPLELAAKPAEKGGKRGMDGIDPLLAQWVEWLDTHAEHSLEGTENFSFEANRAIYAAGRVNEAVARMAKSSAKYPKSKYAIPQASLVLDTYIASQDWERTHDLATEFMDVSEWKKGDFGKKLFAVAADAFYKQVEEKFRARDFKAALKGSDEFLKKYSASARLADTLALAGTAALETIDRPRAEAYLTRLVTEAPTSPNSAAAWLSRASIREDRYQFGPAASDYRAYIVAKQGAKELSKDDRKQIEALRLKVLAMTWLSGDRAQLGARLKDKVLCLEATATECEKYEVLTKMDEPITEESTQKAFSEARHDSNPNRALWAVLALEGGKHLAFRDRNVAVRHAVSGWEDLDPLVKFSVTPRLSRSLAGAFRMNRLALKEVAPLKAHEKWITRRVEVIREMENAATKAMKLPWARIRAEVLNEIAGTYLDLSRGLAALPAPKDLSPSDLQSYEDTIRKLTMPFEEKGQDMRAKAFEIASRFAIEDDSFVAISEPFFAENPSQAKALKGTPQPSRQLASVNGKEPKEAKEVKTIAEPLSLNVAFLNKLDPKGGWNNAKFDESLAYENPALYVKSLWSKALQSNQLPQIAFFMQEAQEKALIQAGIMGAVKAVSLAAAGARGEALAEIEDARKDLQPEARSQVTSLLMRFYQGSFAKEKSQALEAELKGKIAQR
jgi:TolA-binding protein